MGRLHGASDNLFAWAAARVARSPTATFEDILGEMATYGLGELAEEASRILEGELGPRAGSVGGIQVSDTVWSANGPGQGSVIIEGVEWRSWDYKEDIHVSKSWRASAPR